MIGRLPSSTEEAEHDWRTAAERESDMAQARTLREQARKGGLRFEAYLPSSLAEWVLDLVEKGVFTDPGEAVFVILGEHKDLEPACRSQGGDFAANVASRDG